MQTHQSTPKIRRPTGADSDKAKMAEIAEHFRSWSELTQTVSGRLPTAVVAAVSAGRPELVDCAIAEARRPQYEALLKLVKVLLETNLALQVHAEALADKTRALEAGLKGVLGHIRRIDDFANFRVELEEEEEDDQ